MNALEYTRDLVAFGSISSVSNVEVCDHLERVLKKLEFETERVDYVDGAGVKKSNVVGKRTGGPAASGAHPSSGKGGLAYFAHTDVVPADNWFSSEHGPFTPTVTKRAPVRAGKLRHERLARLYPRGRRERVAGEATGSALHHGDG